MKKSKISWCDYTWNPWIGCTKVSPACDHCYAERWCSRWSGKFPFNEITRTSRNTWNKINHYPAGSKIFVCSLSDFYHKDVPYAMRAEAFNMIDSRPDLIFMILTKRPELVDRREIKKHENIWLGVTVENQEQLVTRLDALNSITIKGKKFVSCEPLLERIQFNDYDRLSFYLVPDTYLCLDWVIVGGESGKHRRPLHPEWVKSIQEECKLFDVPFFFKQWCGDGSDGDNLLDGELCQEFPT